MTHNAETKQYMIIVTVGAKTQATFMTKVEAKTHSQAEHKVLDLAYVGKHKSTIVGCQAYDADDMKYSQFIRSALEAIPIDFDGLVGEMTCYNAQLRMMDNAEETVARCERQIRELEAQIEEAKRVLE